MSESLGVVWDCNGIDSNVVCGSVKTMSRADVNAGIKPEKPASPPITAVLMILEQVWHQGEHPAKLAYEEPLDGLIETVLSQNTNDRNRDMAFARLKELGDWRTIDGLPREMIVEAIKPAGISNNKTNTIKRVLKTVKDTYGDYTLQALKVMPVGEVRAFMTGIQGVGPKTAACVLAFDLGIPAFPVDTHVARISKRLGWAEEKETPAEIQERMEKTIPPELQTGGHLNMILHGKNTCKARKPLCGSCPLRGLCPSSSA